jgi:hypothetical protein
MKHCIAKDLQVPEYGTASGTERAELYCRKVGDMGKSEDTSRLYTGLHSKIERDGGKEPT